MVRRYIRVFCDVSNAFDRINHWIIFSKLITIGVPYPLIRIIMSGIELKLFVLGRKNGTLLMLELVTVLDKAEFFLLNYFLFTLMICH